MRRILVWTAALPIILLSAACGKSNTIIVGSKAGTEQTILGEIVAQHLDRRLSAVVERRLSLGSTAVLYQSILAGDVSIYPEYTGVIETDILKEPPADDPQIVLERTRAQMRMAQLELMDPLGFDNPPVVVVHRCRRPRDSNFERGRRQGYDVEVGNRLQLSKRHGRLVGAQQVPPADGLRPSSKLAM